jgi:dihydroceramidase
VYYLYAKDPVFHQVAYGFLTLSSTIRGFYVTEVDVKSALRKRVPAEADQRMRQIRTLAVSGILIFLGGFFIWNMDNLFCHHLVRARNQIQLPWSVVLEGHGWWHILTGLGKSVSPMFLLSPEPHKGHLADVYPRLTQEVCICIARVLVPVANLD